MKNNSIWPQSTPFPEWSAAVIHCKKFVQIIREPLLENKELKIKRSAQWNALYSPVDHWQWYREILSHQRDVNNGVEYRTMRLAESDRSLAFAEHYHSQVPLNRVW